jgi:hypothetical protein
MAYATAGLKCTVAGVGNAPAIWVYTSVDVHTDVDAADYFADGKARGMKVGDVMFVVDSDTGPGNTTVHSVTAVGAVAASISPALLI